MDNKIPKLLRRLKVREGMSDKKMAAVCEKTVSTYKKYEQGVISIPNAVLDRIEARFGVTMVMTIAELEKEQKPKVSYGKGAAAELAKWARDNMSEDQIFDLIMKLDMAQKANLTRGENDGNQGE